MTQINQPTSFITEGNSYSGESSNIGLEVIKMEGNYKQETTNGYQLFDASKLPSKTQGGATVTNNGDGSFTISGSGNLTSEYANAYAFPHEETIKMLKTGKIYLKQNGVSNPIAMVQLNKGDRVNTWFQLNNRINEANITNEMLNDTGCKLAIYIYGSNGLTIENATIKPMLYQNGDGTWEEFTGAMKSPNPYYPQMIKSVNINEFNSHGYQLFDASKLPSKTQGGATVTNNGDGSFTISGSGNTTRIFDNPKTYTHQESIKLLKVGLLKSATTSDVAPYFFFTLNMNNSILYEFRLGKSESSFNITQSMLDNETFFIRIGCYRGNNSPIIAGTIKPMIYQDGDGTWEPFNLETTTLSTPLVLRKLPNGVCDTYENGIITRRIGEVTFDGSGDELWDLNLHEGVIRFYSVILDMKHVGTNRTYCLTNTFYPMLSGNNVGGAFFYENRTFIYPSQDVATVELLKAWLKNNNLTVWYELKDPTTEQFEIPMLPSFYSYTTIVHNSPISTSLMLWKVYEGFFIPKNNWLKDHYINIEDFNRIRANVIYLYYKSKQFYKDYDLSKGLVDEVNYSSYAYSDIWNFLEFTSNDIYNNTYKIKDVGTMMQFSPYQNYIYYDELNRLENLCLKYYLLFKEQSYNIEKLSFTLGDYRGIKI